VFLHAIVDCCTREIAALSLDLRCRDDEAIEVVERAALVGGSDLGGPHSATNASDLR